MKKDFHGLHKCFRLENSLKRGDTLDAGAIVCWPQAHPLCLRKACILLDAVLGADVRDGVARVLTHEDSIMLCTISAAYLIAECNEEE